MPDSYSYFCAGAAVPGGCALPGEHSTHPPGGAGQGGVGGWGGVGGQCMRLRSLACRGVHGMCKGLPTWERKRKGRVPVLSHKAAGAVLRWPPAQRAVPMPDIQTVCECCARRFRQPAEVEAVGAAEVEERLGRIPRDVWGRLYR